MTKRQLIDQIITVNRSAEPGFLARFDDEDLRDYLDHLLVALEPRLTGETHRYEKYFRVPTTATATAVLDTPEQENESPHEDGVWSADSTDDADEARGETDALVPSFIYDQQHSAPVSAPQMPRDDEEEQASDEEQVFEEEQTFEEEQARHEEQAPDEEDDNYLAQDEVEYEDILEDDPVPVGQYADSSFAETDEDMESWLF